MFIARRWKAVGFGVGIGRLDELLRDLPLRVAEDDPRLPLAFGLGLHRHRVLQGRRDQHVLDLDGDDVDAPGLGAQSMIRWSSVLIFSRPSSMSESIVLPITSRSAVCAAQLIAFT